MHLSLDDKTAAVRRPVGLSPVIADRFHIRCTRPDGQSRYERRCAYKSSHHHSETLPLGRLHLGNFDGERKRLTSVTRCPGETLGRDLASLAWLCAFLLVLAFVVGAL